MPIHGERIKVTLRPQKCGRCLGVHNQNNCPFLKEKCFKCGKVGHTRRACKTKAQNPGQPTPHDQQRKPPNRATSVAKAHQVEGTTQENEFGETTETSLYALYEVVPSTPDEIKVTVNVENKPLEFVVDTAATVSVILIAMYKKSFNHIQLKKSQYTLKSYSNDLIPVLGEN